MSKSVPQKKKMGIKSIRKIFKPLIFKNVFYRKNVKYNYH